MTADRPGCSSSLRRGRSAWTAAPGRQGSQPRGALDARRASLGLADLAALPARRASHRPLLPRYWELRDNLTIYDAAYVALAEAMRATLLTADRRLAKAPGPRCPIEILQPAPPQPPPEPASHHHE